MRFSATSRIVDLQREDVDIAIRHGDGNWQGCDSLFMMADDMFPVLSPKLRDARPVVSHGDLADHIWLWVDAEPRADDWSVWLAAAAVDGLEPKGRMAFETSSQALAAAAAGLGIAIAHRPFAMDDLRSGRLAMPFETTVSSAQAFYVVTTSGNTMPPRVSAFRDWLLDEAKFDLSPDS